MGVEGGAGKGTPGRPEAGHRDPRELLERAARGDRAAFDALTRDFFAPVFGYARRALGDEDLAVDVTQDTFVRAWRSRTSFDGRRGSARAWLFAIAANRVRDARRARGEAPAPLEEPGELPAGDPAGLDAFARGALRAEVTAAVEALPPEQREVVALKYLADLSYEEVAQALGLSVGAAKMRALRARDALARALRDHRDSGGSP